MSFQVKIPSSFSALAKWIFFLFIFQFKFLTRNFLFRCCFCYLIQQQTNRLSIWLLFPILASVSIHIFFSLSISLFPISIYLLLLLFFTTLWMACIPFRFISDFDWAKTNVTIALAHTLGLMETIDCMFRPTIRSHINCEESMAMWRVRHINGIEQLLQKVLILLRFCRMLLQNDGIQQHTELTVEFIVINSIHIGIAKWKIASRQLKLNSTNWRVLIQLQICFSAMGKY